MNAENLRQGEPADAAEKDIKALDALFQEVGTYKKSSELMELLNFIKKFPKIAPFNAHLLHIQKPGSRFVTYAPTWKNEYGRTIKPGARPLIILVPFGPVGYVFELEDTEGEPFPEELLKPFKTEGTIPNTLFNTLIRNLPRKGILYIEADYGTTRAGMIEIADQKGRQFLYSYKFKNKQHDVFAQILYNLCVNKNLSKEDIFATIVHELAHLHCGHLGAPYPKWWPDRRYIKHNASEFEAECVTWLICERLGLKNPSVQYLANFLDNNKTIPDISLDRVLKAAGDIENMTTKTITAEKEIIVK